MAVSETTSATHSASATDSTATDATTRVATDKKRQPKAIYDIFRDQVMAWVISTPAIVLMILFLIGPIFSVLYLSFTDWEFGMDEFAYVGFDNYVALANDKVFIKSFFNTLAYVGMVLPGSVIGGLLIAMLIESRPSGKAFYRTVFFLPVMATLIAMSIVWEFILQPDFGLLNQLMNLLGYEGENWLNNKNTVLFVLAGIGIWHQLGYNMVLFISGIMAIPKHLYEAADMDGIPHGFSRFWLITWPMLAPVTLFVVVITSIKAFQVFDTVHVLTSGGPNKSSEVLLYTMYTEAFSFFRTGYAAAITVVFLLFILLITVLKVKFLDKRVHY